MERAKASQRIERIIHDVEAGRFPARVKELHVFGSYARGAIQLGDLDLILIHEPPPADIMAALKSEGERKYGKHVFAWPRRTHPQRKFAAMMQKVARKPGEKMDLLMDISLEQLLSMYTITGSKRVLIWSVEDRDWQAKLAAIPSDEAASRYDRGHFADLKRFNGFLEGMNEVSDAIRSGELRLTRINAEEFKPKLNPLYQYWYDHWVRCNVMGKDSMKLLRHGMWWIQQQKGQSRRRPHPPYHDGTMMSDKMDFAVHFGRPPVHAAWRVTDKEHPVRAACMIPHFKRGQSNELLIFERGEIASSRS